MNNFKLANSLKQVFGGTIEYRPYPHDVTLEIEDQKTILEILKMINGESRHYPRIKQIQEVCGYYKIEYEKWSPLNLENHWFSGFFDGLGDIHMQELELQLFMHSRYKFPLSLFYKNFGGQFRSSVFSQYYYTWG